MSFRATGLVTKQLSLVCGSVAIGLGDSNGAWPVPILGEPVTNSFYRIIYYASSKNTCRY